MDDAPRSMRLSPLALAAVAVLILAVGALFAIDRVRGDRIAAGVTVDGIHVGELSTAEAGARLRAALAEPLGESVVAVRGGRSFELPPARSGLRVDVETTVERARELSREGFAPARVLGDLLGSRTVDVDLEPQIAFSRRAVIGFVREVADEIDRPPRDAYIEVDSGGLTARPAVDGVAVEVTRLARRVGEALRSRADARVGIPVRVRAAPTTLGDLAAEHPDYLVVDREGFRLLHYEELRLHREYPISVGDIGHATPAGEYEITSKAVNPTWYVPDSEWAGDLAGEVIPPGPENPIKSRWLGIRDGIGIHGTDEVDSIGRRASRGCIRMLISDVEELYDRVPIGTPTYIG